MAVRFRLGPSNDHYAPRSVWQPRADQRFIPTTGDLTTKSRMVSGAAATQFSVYPEEVDGRMLPRLRVTLRAVDEINTWIPARLDRA